MTKKKKIGNKKDFKIESYAREATDEEAKEMDEFLWGTKK